MEEVDDRFGVAVAGLALAAVVPVALIGRRPALIGAPAARTGAGSP